MSLREGVSQVPLNEAEDRLMGPTFPTRVDGGQLRLMNLRRSVVKSVDGTHKEAGIEQMGSDSVAGYLERRIASTVNRLQVLEPTQSYQEVLISDIIEPNLADGLIVGGDIFMGDNLDAQTAEEKVKVESISVDEIADHYAEIVVAPAAVTGMKTMLAAYEGREKLTPEEIKKLKVQVDNAATQVAEKGFKMEGVGKGKRKANVKTQLDGFEGQKEGRKNKAEAVRHLNGDHGPKEMHEDIPTITVSMFMDVIEGTTFLANNQKRAISIVAGIEGGSIQKPPSEDEWQYTDIFAAGARMKDILTPEMTFEEKIDAIINAYGKEDAPWEVEMRILGGEDRIRNHEDIAIGRAKGITVVELENGDCAPMVEALLSDKPIFSAGSGGKEEVRIAAVASILGEGYWTGQNVKVDKQKRIIGRDEKIYRDTDIVTGDRDKAFLVAVGVTGEDYLGLKPLEKVVAENGSVVWKADSMKVTCNGVRREIINVTTN